MSVLEYILSPFFFPFVYAPLALCHPPLPVMSCTAKKTIQKGFLFWTFSSFFSFASSSFPNPPLHSSFYFNPAVPLLFSYPHPPSLSSTPPDFYSWAFLLESLLHSFSSFCFIFLLLIEKTQFSSSFSVCLCQRGEFAEPTESIPFCIRHFLSHVASIQANVRNLFWCRWNILRVFAPLRLCCLMSRDDRKERKWATIEQTECNNEIVVLTAMKRDVLLGTKKEASWETCTQWPGKWRNPLLFIWFEHFLQQRRPH